MVNLDSICKKLLKGFFVSGSRLISQHLKVKTQLTLILRIFIIMLFQLLMNFKKRFSIKSTYVFAFSYFLFNLFLLLHYFSAKSESRFNFFLMNFRKLLFTSVDDSPMALLSILFNLFHLWMIHCFDLSFDNFFYKMLKKNEVLTS